MKQNKVYNDTIYLIAMENDKQFCDTARWCIVHFMSQKLINTIIIKGKNQWIEWKRDIFNYLIIMLIITNNGKLNVWIIDDAKCYHCALLHVIFLK